MWLVPAFHQGPRPLLADFHARTPSSPRACSRLLRVAGRFHCRQSRQRSLRRIHPSKSCNTPFTSVSRKQDVQPRSTGLSAAIVWPRLREAFRRRFHALCLSVASSDCPRSPVSPAFQFTVQVGQQDVRQQRGQGAALRRAFLALTIPSDIMPASR